MVNVAVIGCGSIAKQRHAYEYSKNKDACIKGFFDVSKERAEEFTKLFGGKVYSTVDEIFQDKEVDAVSICTANKFHADLAVKALESGKHVLCEKPMATTLEDCERMIEAEKKSGKKLLIGQNQRLTKVHKKAKEIIESGELGKVLTFQATFGHKGPEMWSADKGAHTWFFKKDQACFGSMADLGIHKLDIIRYLIGCEIKEVYAKMTTLDKKLPDGKPIEVDDNSIEVITFENGAQGTITTSWTTYGEECNVTYIFLQKGIMKIYVDPKFPLVVINSDGTKTMYELEKLQTNDDAQQASSGVIDLFIDAIENNKKTVLDVEYILGSMRAVFAAVKSNEEKRPIAL